MKRHIASVLSILLCACGGDAAPAPAAPAAHCHAVVSQSEGEVSVVVNVTRGWTARSVTLTFDRSPDSALASGCLDWVRADDGDGFHWCATADGTTLRLEAPSKTAVLTPGLWTARVGILRKGDETPQAGRSAVCEEAPATP